MMLRLPWNKTELTIFARMKSVIYIFQVALLHLEPYIETHNTFLYKSNFGFIFLIQIKSKRAVGAFESDVVGTAGSEDVADGRR